MQLPDNPETIIEQDIIGAFGSSIIEFEAVLYQKFLRISAATSLFSEKQFRKKLNDMHAKGYLSPTEFNGQKCWKRLVVLDDLEGTNITPDEFEDVFRERMIVSSSGSREPAVKKGIVSNSSNVAEEIRDVMLATLAKDTTSDEIQSHAKQMRRALSSSSDEFLAYLKQNLPSMVEPMETILREKGENVLLLGLRIVGTS